MASPITNTHVHIFTGDHVPKYIAKKILPWPLYYLTHVHVIVDIFKWWKKHERKLDGLRLTREKTLGNIKSCWISWIAYSLLVGLLLINSLYFILDYFGAIKAFTEWISPHLANNLGEIGELFLLPLSTPSQQIAVIIITTLLSSNARKLIWHLLSFFITPLKLLKSEQLSFYQRYLDILEFTKLGKSSTIFNKLKKMYPEDSQFVVLPMDMEYMGAGSPKESYLVQLDELNKLFYSKGSNGGISTTKTDLQYKKQLIPFVFVDPRRIIEKGGKAFFDYETTPKGDIKLNECLLKKYLVKEKGDPTRGNFCGIKIYPALGYYPSHPALLPLWRYCAQEGIPITTHTTLGSMYYRGLIKKKWFKHPLFRNGDNSDFILARSTNRDLQINFSHPLNYLGLLEPKFLHAYLKRLNDEEINKVFGITEDGNYTKSLCSLKINFAHFGGTEQWTKFIKEDRNQEILRMTSGEKRSLNFFYDKEDEKDNPLGKPAWLWSNQKVDWFSVIISLMRQYDGVYADISYILHDTDLMPLIQQIMKDEVIKKRVLFGTDFYVVRNHKSEKELVYDWSHGLDQKTLDLIARKNPKEFLNQESLDNKC